MLKRYLPKSLYARVALIVILPIFLMQSFVTYVFFERHWDLVSANLSANVASQIALIAKLYRETTDPEERRAIERLSTEELELNVRFEPRKTIPDADKLSIFTLHNRTLERQLDERLEEDFWFNTYSWPAYVEIRVQLDDGYLVFLPRRDRVFATTGPIFVMWLIGVTLLLGSIAIVFLRNQVRSILRLAEAAEAFGRGRDAPDFRPSGAAEVRRAGLAFIAMRERIKRHIHQRTAMLAGVSHDLRTPLTRLKLALAMQPDSPDMEALRADVAEMERMVESYLSFARDLASDEAPGEVDLGALLGEIVEDAARSGKEVALDVAPGLRLAARRNALKRAINNLVENGLKYADHVWLSAKRTGGTVEIVVDDDGPGVPPERHEEAFKPFARLDEGRRRDPDGVGLGLAVVRDVARSHGGEAALARAPQGGLRAVLRLPG
ncbi:ATP-binding protein [Amphiplicatus metriothermophilus]|uniref:histidine kinase n=1 Tax=Amphiplicatus metriothermophilus TaxID=1519374 RepID=A0A239PY66_9PROT|nr:ATP-binding protein [Amphiplicatus metriothermophilus]MBB5520003.1 two-component system osmolarity sensor histidine kinase EnvZ [Amphiplicatus metriothermophilus]SNT74902.1 two-component system, OmpR family, osmolarity sensor histidine kinase EnvZ [Amphiplicatus metriothermophilus]